MMNVTEGARDRLLSKLVSKKAAAGEAMRFIRRKGGWKLRLAQTDPDDATVVHRGRKVLVMDQDVSDAMTAMTLDVRQTRGGPRLTLHRHAKRRR